KRSVFVVCFFFQAEDGIRDRNVTGVQTCALPISVLTSHVLRKIGMTTDPAPADKRTDLIQTVSFNSEDEMIKFTQMIQKASPVNAKFMPIPDLIPGYQNPVIMAAGTFEIGRARLNSSHVSISYAVFCLKKKR